MQAETTRKLIDIKAPVFNSLALKAKRKGVSAPAGVTDGKILSLIGLAKPSIRPSDLEDERLQYILNK